MYKINRKVAFSIQYSRTKKSKYCCHPPFHPPIFCRYFSKLLSPTLSKLMNWILLSPPPLSSDPENPPKFGTCTCGVWVEPLIWDSFNSSYIISLKCSDFIVGVIVWLKLILIYISHTSCLIRTGLKVSLGLPGSLDKAIILIVGPPLSNSAIGDLITQRSFTHIGTVPSGCGYHFWCVLH